MPDRFTVLVETRRPLAPVTLTDGVVLGCGTCAAILKDVAWVHPVDRDTPAAAPTAQCTRCALRSGLSVLMVGPADETGRMWQPPVVPEPEMVAVEFPGGAVVRMPQDAVRWSRAEAG